jgi:hypothetical protein
MIHSRDKNSPTDSLSLSVSLSLKLTFLAGLSTAQISLFCLQCDVCCCVHVSLSLSLFQRIGHRVPNGKAAKAFHTTLCVNSISRRLIIKTAA